jgi:pseudouridine-5'-phosphate glycosidase
VLTSEDRAHMTADLQAIRDDRPVSIAIRRNGATLAAQTVRIARGGNVQAGVTDTEGLQGAGCGVRERDFTWGYFYQGTGD